MVDPRLRVTGALWPTRLSVVHAYLRIGIFSRIMKTAQVRTKIACLQLATEGKPSRGHRCCVAYDHVFRFQISRIVLEETPYRVATALLLPRIDWLALFKDPKLFAKEILSIYISAA